jgi:hypothetical protein
MWRWGRHVAYVHLLPLAILAALFVVAAAVVASGFRVEDEWEPIDSYDYPNEYGEWEPWFAWRPIRNIDHQRWWLLRLERRWLRFDDTMVREYRKRPKHRKRRDVSGANKKQI